ncbi:MAG: hypothetical protein KAY65_09675, partial [Planctomycetes bacterium]|nr:hypothetical protein [Planctomycetota bacterium]
NLEYRSFWKSSAGTMGHPQAALEAGTRRHRLDNNAPATGGGAKYVTGGAGDLGNPQGAAWGLSM